MAFVQYMILYIVKNMGLILLDPIFFLLAIAVIHLYKREIKKIQRQIDERAYTLCAIGNIAIGMIVGVIVSGVLSYYKIHFYLSNEVLVLIPIAILMMLIQPKLGCFSYVLLAAYLIEGALKLVHLPFYNLQYQELIIMVGALHLLEGILIMLSGDKLSLKTPMYENGKIVTGHIFRQIWMVPFIFIAQGMPIPLYTVLAYGDVTSEVKKQKYITGMLILTYGISILGLSYLVTTWQFPIGALIILMPVLHEFIFILSHVNIRKN